MSALDSLSRLAEYYRRHGLAATTRRMLLATKRMLFAGRMVVFYCDLNQRSLPKPNLLKAVSIKKLTTPDKLSTERLKQIASVWNPKLATRNIKERFEKGATLWLIEYEGRLAGYGWTLRGRTMEPYYFPLAPEDAHLFDFHVFPRYRGQGLNPYLVSFILNDFAMDHCARAFIEATEWNEAQLLSLRKTSFQRLGSVRAFSIFGHVFVSWVEKQSASKDAEDVRPPHQVLRAARSNEH